MPDWPEARIARGDLSEQIRRLKREPGKDLIAYGGSVVLIAVTAPGAADLGE